ncbi:MAG: O-antigen ligase family protein [Actinobacteria bacterium]|nr:O-antigen ligase family protein [Actinomycetota bacterium]
MRTVASKQHRFHTRTSLFRTKRSDSFRLGRAVVSMMLVVTLDVTNYLDRGGTARYLLLLIPLLTVVAIRLRDRSPFVRRMSVPDRVLLIFMLYGLAGAVYGDAFRHTQSTALPVFLPMILAFAYLAVIHKPTQVEARTIIRWLAVVGLVYAVTNAVANTGMFHSLLAAKSYRNSKVFFIYMGVVAAFLSRRRLVLAAILCLLGFIFATYPSGTDVVVTVVTTLTLWATQPGRSSLRPYVVGVLGILLLLVAVYNLSKASSLASAYFETVGKSNNTDTRLALWQGGIAVFKESPIYGSAFSGELTITVYRRPPDGSPFKAPFHDDYVMMLALGGLIGLALGVWWIVATEQNVLRRYRGFLASGEREHAVLLRALLVGFNVLFSAALFNPELSAVGRGASIFGVYSLMMLGGNPDLGTESGWSR